MRLRTLLATAFAALALAITVAAAIGVEQLAGNRLRERVGRELSQLAAQVETLLDTNMSERWIDMQVLATAASTVSRSPDAERVWLDGLRRANPNYAWIGFADAAGTVTASTGRLLEGVSVAARPWFVEGLKGPFAGDVHEAKLLAKLLPPATDGAPQRFVDVAAPVRDRSGAVVGVLGGHLSWSWATALARGALKPALDRDPRIEVVILDREGTVLMGPSHLADARLPESDWATAAREPSSYGLSTQADGSTYLVGRSRLEGVNEYPGLGWTVLVRQPSDAAYAPARQLAREIAAGGSLLALVFALAGWVVAGRIAAPLLSLAEATRTPGDGGRLALPALKGPDEVRTLNRALGALSDRVAQRDSDLAAVNASLEREVSERTRALAESEAFLQEILRTSPDCIKVLDADGQVAFLNERGACLLELDEPGRLIGCDFSAIFPAGERARITAALAEAREGRSSELLIACPTIKGRPAWWQIGVTPMGGGEAGAQPDPTRRILVVSRDVTERETRAGEVRLARDLAELAQARAENASRAKTEFVATMSHEIRTPLNAIQGFGDLLAADERLDPTQRRYVEAISASSAALRSIVDDVLDFAAIEAGALRLDPRPFDLDGLVDGAGDIVRLTAERKGLALELRVDPAARRWWCGDEGRLRQILVNLLGNAVKFTEAGRVRLSIGCEAATDTGARLRFAVQDTGIGIPEDRVAQVFAKFTQADGSISRRFGGTGLGLAITKRLVEAMDGTIGVESRVGEGTTFEVVLTLPFAEAPKAASPHAPAAGDEAVVPRLLVVDDLELNRAVAKAVLERAGYAVETAASGEEALARLPDGGFDLVLMDAQMPGLDGIATTRAIRALMHPARRTPIVALSANVLPEQVRLYTQAGMNGFLGKPFKWDDLKAVVEAHLPDVIDVTRGAPHRAAAS